MTFSHLFRLAAGLSMAGLLTACGGAGNQGAASSSVAIEVSNPAEGEVFWYLKDIRSEMCPNWFNRSEKEAVDFAYLFMKLPGDLGLDVSMYSEADVRSAILAWYEKNCE